ncbi:MAG TPA: tRNA (adenosine(37)-N6)-threonylcarbamoyltransferase complex dimerization subunit type 1 TsaB [Verrucomicrobiota bacterium]|nr:tRNA (adenosine(37)-N6)-threonylcarbamoyltransferase complex dimerization subunit type 1 TsaB [Verrucomicrobiota bacterium]
MIQAGAFVMKILALEFSTGHRTVAALDTEAMDNARAPAIEIEEVQGRSVRACAMVESALRKAGLARESVDTVAVGLGPGSYAGIRTAIAFALGWHMARTVRLAGISSIECLVAGLESRGTSGSLLAAVDAQRGEFYLAGYELGPTGWREVEPLHLASGEELERRVRAGARVVGPDIPSHIRGVQRVFPDAAILARLAAGRAGLERGARLEPIHLRPTRFVKAPPPRAV